MSKEEPPPVQAVRAVFLVIVAVIAVGGALARFSDLLSIPHYGLLVAFVAASAPVYFALVSPSRDQLTPLALFSICVFYAVVSQVSASMGAPTWFSSYSEVINTYSLVVMSLGSLLYWFSEGRKINDRVTWLDRIADAVIRATPDRIQAWFGVEPHYSVNESDDGQQ